MDVKEAERVVVAKPVASRPSCPSFRSFSELLAGAINVSPSIEPSQTTVSAIRPRTVRFKPPMTRPPTTSGFVSSEANPSYKSYKPEETNHNQSVVYKPMAKLVSKATVSVLANMGNFSTTSHQQFQHPNQVEKLRPTNLITNHHHQNHQATSESLKMAAPVQIIEDEQKTSPSTSNNNNNGGSDRPCYDGYNWRKYGQKQVKGSEYPRSYYKCTHPNCPVKKKVERSFDGQIAEIVYKGEHNHSKPQPPKRNSSSGMACDGLVLGGQDGNNPLWSGSAPHHHNGDQRNEGRIMENQNNERGGFHENSCGQSGECEEGSKVFEADHQEDEPRRKRRKNIEKQNCNEGGEEGIVEGGEVVVQSCTDSEIVGDGFRWRKYGQKVVKGNPFPRSYYRCTNIKCSARKHVERSIDDPRAFITTYEGKHNHDMPRKTTPPNNPIPMLSHKHPTKTPH
ncbi:WRKY transcription factor 44 [Senna tora]|uniref:WRKY transcription factor 44 n=1 Tax=Senna tora TaxID=362788 RepID=A0A834TB17_9FABA|nr:WRKY transcription factor 44 [Senna tora]